MGFYGRRHGDPLKVFQSEPVFRVVCGVCNGILDREGKRWKQSNLPDDKRTAHFHSMSEVRKTCEKHLTECEGRDRWGFSSDPPMLPGRFLIESTWSISLYEEG